MFLKTLFLGDPIAYHATYIIKCIENYEVPLSAFEIVQLGRLGNSVKKTFALATLNSNNAVEYISINWMESV